MGAVFYICTKLLNYVRHWLLCRRLPVAGHMPDAAPQPGRGPAGPCRSPGVSCVGPACPTQHPTPPPSPGSQSAMMQIRTTVCWKPHKHFQRDAPARLVRRFGRLSIPLLPGALSLCTQSPLAPSPVTSNSAGGKQCHATTVVLHETTSSCLEALLRQLLPQGVCRKLKQPQNSAPYGFGQSPAAPHPAALRVCGKRRETRGLPQPFTACHKLPQTQCRNSIVSRNGVQRSGGGRVGWRGGGRRRRERGCDVWGGGGGERCGRGGKGRGRGAGERGRAALSATCGPAPALIDGVS